MKRICSVYRCTKKEGLYLYLDKDRDVTTLPDVLVQQTGRLERVMTLLVTVDKKLARADASQVLEAIATQGFYLQMPPTQMPSMSFSVR